MSSQDDIACKKCAIWIDGPFKCNESDKIRRKRIPNKKVVLEYLNNSQNNNITKEFLNEVKSYSIENDDYSNIITIYGISQNPDTKDYVIVLEDCYCVNCGKIYTDKRYKWCNPCLLNELKQNFENWTSGNEKVDEFIQQMKLQVKSLDDSIFEWIPYNQLNTIKEIDMTLYSAIWINGPLRYNYDKMEWEKIPNEKINLIYFDSSLKLTKQDDVPYDKMCGISQDPDTNNYILIFQDCYCKNCVEWIPYNQFNDIKKVGDDDSANILYSATWMDGLLEYDCNKIEYKRIPNKEVGLKYFGNNIINEFLNEIKSYFAEHSKRVDIYGISQDPVAKDYVMVLQNGYCEIFEWIPYNQFNDFKILYESDFVILYSAIFVNGPFCYNYDKMEWKREPNEKVTLIRLNNLEITIDQILNKIKEYIDERRWRDTTIKLNKTHKELFYAEGYITVSQNNNIVKVYGISQNPDSKDYIIVLQDWCCENCNEMYESKEYKWCNSCQIDNLKQSFANWTSENEQIDEIVQNLQLDIKKHNDIIVEWIPYNHFNNIKELVKGDYATLYLANWMNGLLRFEYYKWKRRPNAKVTLKCLHNSQDITDEILNEKIESYYIRNIEGKNEEEGHYCYRLPKIYGISRNPNTKDYIMVLENGNHCETCGEIYTEIDSKWCESCQVNNLIKNFTNWTSGNEIIDKFIQGIQLVLQSHRRDITVEWIPYNQFNDIEKIGNDSAILYSATWIDGPLEYDEIEWERISNKKVTLKYLYDSYNITNKSLNEEVESYINGYFDIPIIYGMSQNPDTNDYILVLRDEIVCEKCIQIYTDISSKECNPCKINDLKQNFANWTSGNKQIDELIQKMQLESKDYDTVVEWVPYNQLSNIKRIGKIDSNILYSATWIKWDYEVALKYLSNLKNNNTDEFLNEIKSYFIEYKSKIYGLSQDPSTKDYIVVLQSGSHCKICGRLYINSWCKSCQMSVLKNNFENWTIEWIPYDQLNDIKEIVNNKCIRNHNNKEVALKNLCNSQNINEFLNEVKSYFFTVDVPSHDINFTPKIYGISQNLDTKDYIIVLDDCYCENCGKIYTDIGNKWCKPCQIEDIKRGFANWTSENKKIDKLIQEMQLKINKYNDIIVEWIPYDQFNDIKKRGKGGFSTVYSASWTDGPLRYRKDYKKLKRKCNEEVALKCLHNSQNITNGFLHEVKNYSISDDDGILKIYGISQNPRTKDYIIVLQLASGNFAECKYIKKPWYWTEKLHILNGIIDCLKDIHDNKMVHRDLHIGNILTLPHVTINSFRGNIIQKVCISDMGLCREICNLDNMDETKVYGVLPYVAPEVLRGKSYTQAADIYSFGMIMYFVATRRQPFANCAHDEALALNICNGIRPEINELEVPKSYIELMKKCWNSNPDDRPKTIEIKEEINKQIEEAEKNKMNFSFTGNNKPTHSQAFYTSRLLNPFTKNFRKYDNISNNSIEVIDFTKVI
ncbi:kinase-like domain-containing protein [Rhizophagus clarus]|uniref:Kinase-like domain-containing protein n=1 Tax=Rhizophagus clarus TaxID=94130 RepID=A0A8H3L880_9GLOM|nr:kinase-like domain-containing protein [Rhizophagus clarus]